MDTQVAQEARGLLLRRDFGVFGTLSVKVEGYPFGSVTPYCMQYDGAPLILISTISQHYRNACADERVSLTIMDPPQDNVQTGARICVLAKAEQVDDQDLTTRYLRYFPSAEQNLKAHDFVLFQLVPVRAFYIGGFGKIHWFEPEGLFVTNPFDASTESGIVEHMNDDHADALARYWRRSGAGEPGGEVRMCGIDAEGCDLVCGDRRLRIPFDRSIATTGEAREILTELARS